MYELFKKVFDRVSKLSDAELRERLDGVADHPLVKVYEAVAYSNDTFSYLCFDEAFSKQGVASYLLAQGISYDDILRTDDYWAANDERFLLAA